LRSSSRLRFGHVGLEEGHGQEVAEKSRVITPIEKLKYGPLRTCAEVTGVGKAVGRLLCLSILRNILKLPEFV
jgi:hypothetical protein